MNYKQVETFCLALPGVTRHTPWGDSIVFKVGGKMFACIGAVVPGVSARPTASKPRKC